MLQCASSMLWHQLKRARRASATEHIRPGRACGLWFWKLRRVGGTSSRYRNMANASQTP